MIVGNPRASTAEEAAGHSGVGHICLENTRTREPLGKGFPKTPCKEGIMTQVFFPKRVSQCVSYQSAYII
jgi:hypothetical protein